MFSSKKKSSRTLMTVGAAAVSLVTLAGCGTASAQAKSAAAVQDITLWESHSSGGPAGQTMTSLVKQFNASHHTVHVQLVVTKASHKALGALAAGDAPVLAEISHYDGNFLTAHALVSWNSLLSTVPASETSAVFPVVWHNGEVNGQHYRIEADAKVSQITYNKTLFAQAGITAPPTTWAQLAQDAALVKAKDPGVIPIAWKDSSAHILPPFLSNGGQIFQPGSHGKSADFQSAAATATFNYFRSLYQKNELIFAHGTEIRADFGSGKLAMADGTSAGYQKILDAAGGKFPVGVFAYPDGSTGHPANLVQGLGFVLMTSHTHAQDLAAGKFLAWWLTPATQAYWGEHSGYPPVTSTGEAQMPSTFLASHPGLTVANQILTSPYTISRPVPTSYKEVQAVLDTAFFNAVTGRQSVAQALASLQKQADGYLSGQSAL